VTPDELDGWLGTDEYFTNPYPVFRLLREHDPVHWSDRWGVWVLTRHDDVTAALRDHERFSSCGRVEALAELLPAEHRGAAEVIIRHRSEGMQMVDPPEHTQLRGLVRQAFTSALMERMASRTHEVLDALLDRLAGAGSADLIREVAHRLPFTIVCDMLAVPVPDRDRVSRWLDDVAGFHLSRDARIDDIRRTVRCIVEIEQFFRRLCAERRAAPRDDLVSALTRAGTSGDLLTDSEIVNLSIGFIIAGRATTACLLGTGMYTLLDHPEALLEVRQHPDRCDAAVEECLRYESPLQRAWRRVTNDVHLRGRRLRAGQVVFLMLGAANRDPERFADPDCFDIGRARGPHLAFGHAAHHCMGALLGRKEAAIAFGTLLRRLPRLRLAGRPRWQADVNLRALTTLPVAWESTPGRAVTKEETHAD
jgi:cytochrome P450